MKRTSILAIGFSALLGFGVLAPGCGSDSDNGKKDSSVDTKKMDAAPDGPKGTGGLMGGTGGSTGAGGGTVITGSGGSTGAGGATTVVEGGRDGGLDVPKLDVGSDRGGDGRDVSIAEVGPEVQNKDVALDQQLDKPRVLDVTIDSEPAGVDVGGLDVGGVDGGID